VFAVVVESLVELLLAAQLLVLHDALELLLGQTHQHVLRLEVSVDHSADSVQEVQPHEHLAGDLLYYVDGKTFAVVFLQDLPQVNTEDLKHHAKVVAVWSLVEEGVEQVQHMAIIPIVLLLIRLVVLE
jgi:hypothetical protein